MTTNISYTDLATILEKYYRKEYEGYDIKVTLRPYDKKYRSMGLFSDEWLSYYEFSGTLKRSKVFDELNLLHPIVIQTELSNIEIKNALYRQLNEIFAEEHLSVDGIKPNGNGATIVLKPAKENEKNKEFVKSKKVEE